MNKTTMLYSVNIINRRLVYKVSVIIIITVVGVLFYGSINGYYSDYSLVRDKPNFNLINDYELDPLEEHKQIVHNFYDKRRNWETSNLGSILFKLSDRQMFTRSSRQNRTYVILIWRYFEWLNKRHVYNFINQSSNGTQLTDLLQDCPVQNCEFTGNDDLMPTVDAVVIHMQKGIYPKVDDRNLHQRWIFLSDESPKHTFTLAGKHKPTFKELANVFNWTMTYRSDSDIPVPYGRTLPLTTPHFTYVDNEVKSIENLIPYWDIKNPDILTTILISNCGIKERIKFLKELQRHIPVHIFGKCSDNKEFIDVCPGHFKNDCEILQQYKFYLVLENANCRQYVTEKIFNNAYSKGAIPIIMGPPLSDCEKLLPPESFIHVSKFKTTFDLAQYIRMLAGNYIALMSYHRWRNHFYIANEHGYFKSKSIHYCRVCEALNYNDGEISIYNEDDLRLFIDPSISCT